MGGVYSLSACWLYLGVETLKAIIVQSLRLKKIILPQNKSMKKIMILVMVVSSVSMALAQQESGVRNLSVTEYQRAIDSVKDEIIIDLRTPEEIRQGIITNARQIDFFGAGFEPAIAKLNKDKVYFLYCASGARSGETVLLMEKMDFKTLYNLNGGFRIGSSARTSI